MHEQRILKRQSRVVRQGAGRGAPRTKFCEVFGDQKGGKIDYQDYNGI